MRLGPLPGAPGRHRVRRRVFAAAAPELREAHRLQVQDERQGHPEGPREVGVPLDPLPNVPDEALSASEVSSVSKGDEGVVQHEPTGPGETKQPHEDRRE